MVTMSLATVIELIATRLSFMNAQGAVLVDFWNVRNWWNVGGYRDGPGVQPCTLPKALFHSPAKAVAKRCVARAKVR